MIQSLETLPADTLRAVLREVFASAAYQWEEQTDPFAFFTNFINRIVDWLDGVRELHPALYWLILGLMTGLLLAIVVHVCVLIWLALKPRAPTTDTTADVTSPRHDVHWHLEEWRRLRDAGRFRQALAHRFTALILELEQRKALTFHPSKTPREYAAEARLDEAGQSVLAALVSALYRHVFGGAQCTVEDVDRFHENAERLVSVGGWVAA